MIKCPREEIKNINKNERKSWENAATSSVNASGSVEHIITDTEVGTFGIQDENLKNATRRLDFVH
ncbi:hypothetical protein SAMN05216315_1302 [Nitrosospira sp. Nsp18]|nr:hypothetical protein SAMN05216315_1302 [Nitrosospira sp. Nsp18]